MKKIVSITTVKNEADIIESFVRYHLNIVDLMIILNNGSTDDTVFILNKLIEEDLPIVVINDEDKYFEPMEKYNSLLKKAVNDYDADIVCPLDVDEFLTSDTGNPRDIIQNMPPFTFYKIKWRTYVPSHQDNNDEKFIPSKIRNIRDEDIETFYKVVLTGDLSYHYNARLRTGNHNLNVKDNFKNDVNCEERFDLKIAHFPLRSIEQMTSKILVSYPNVLSRKNVNPNMSHHYPLMFNKYLKEGAIEIDDIIEFAKQYSLEENKGRAELEYKDIEVSYHPMNLDFCKDIDIKYDFLLKPFNNVLENYVYFAEEIHNFKKDKEFNLNNIDNLKKEKEELQTQVKEKIILIGDKDKDIRLLNNKINQFEKNSEEYDLEINDLRNSNKEMKNSINELNEEITFLNESNDNKDKELDFLNNLFTKKAKELENYKNSHESDLNNLKNSNKMMKDTINNLNMEKTILKDNNKESLNTINFLKSKLSEFKDSKSELNYLRVENDFIINHNKLSKKITSKFSYLYLIFKSKPKSLVLNIKLLQALKKSEIFNVGFYLCKYPDLADSKVCNFFSPELHYVCYGFYENRLINKNFSEIGDKESLLDKIYNDGDL